MPELVLLTPGPVRIPERVANALSNPPCNYHRQEAFTSMFVETERMLKQLIGIEQPDAYFATVMTATGTGANEACMLAFEHLGKGLVLTVIPETIVIFGLVMAILLWLNI